ncbi:MAG: hypothetical protein J1E98_03935 [Lachnospiraceae bacterium]|nr:hypothetical protein [Lachnospiraceae bacterium]
MKNHILTASILMLILLLIMTGCGNNRYRVHNKKADDKISKAIYEKVDKKVYYQGRRFGGEDGSYVWYEYVIRDYEDKDIIVDIADVVNEEIEEDKIVGKIGIQFYEEMLGGIETVAILYNYYDEDGGFEQYNSFQGLEVWGTRRSYREDDSPYNKASTYIKLKDIRSLIVTDKIAKAAEEEDIDWYDVWPDLEYYEEVDRFK